MNRRDFLLFLSSAPFFAQTPLPGVAWHGAKKSHPNDLGFTRRAAEFQRVLRPIVK
jgi:hypothetical protein